MNYFKSIHKLLLFSLAFFGFGALTSCTDDDLGKEEKAYDPDEDPEMVVLPFNIAYGVQASTREGEDEKNDFLDGSSIEHAINFDGENECFAIFFGVDEDGTKDVVKYIKKLYYNEQVGKAGKVPSGSTEYTVPVVAYIPKSDCIEEKRLDGLTLWKPKLLKVLIVLNGSPIYKAIHDVIYDSEGNVKKNVKVEDILGVKWLNHANYSYGDYTKDDPHSDGRIGFSGEYFTLANSAYYGRDKETGAYVLKTAAEIEGHAYSSISDYLANEKETTATVYLERMVSKFTSPTFKNAVIGSDLVFRPDLNAMNIVVHSWNGELPVFTNKGWRIHLLGWAINGYESESFIFKYIGPPNEYEEDWPWPQWNDENNHRSYWSIDPHYSEEDLTDENFEYFYPWQFRKAANLDEIVSIQAALAEGRKIPALRYNNWWTLVNSWSWRDVLYLHENTFNPYDYFPNHVDFLDSRATVLAGPHLLIAGELYLQQENGSYIGEYDTVDHIYSDRMRRYYMTEADWFKRFVMDLNETMRAQETMNFPVYDWDEHSEGKSGNTYVADMRGVIPKLFYKYANSRESEFSKFGGQKYVNLDGEGYTYLEFTFDLIDYLYQKNLKSDDQALKDHPLSNVASVRDGDGRLIPWIENIKILATYTENKIDNQGNIVVDADKNPVTEQVTRELKYRLENSENLIADPWNDDMYKTFFHEWFGPIDHYNEGRMYYAGEIRHHEKGAQFDANYFGNVRNHIYNFYVESINSLGIPIDDPNQLIIPGRYNYRDQVTVYLDIIDWHPKSTNVDL